MQVKSFEWQGFCSRERIRCTRGILQGCPRSCALLAGLMTVWCRYVQQHNRPSVQLSVYIDDRTLWCKERQPLQLALDASQSVDQVLGLRLNCSKCELFYKCRNAQLQAFQSWNVACNRKWKMATHFKLLGVHYFSTKARRRPIEPAVVAKVQARLRRLRMATHRRWSKRRACEVTCPVLVFAHRCLDHHSQENSCKNGDMLLRQPCWVILNLGDPDI